MQTVHLQHDTERYIQAARSTEQCGHTLPQLANDRPQKNGHAGHNCARIRGQQHLNKAVGRAVRGVRSEGGGALHVNAAAAAPAACCVLHVKQLTAADESAAVHERIPAMLLMRIAYTELKPANRGILAE